MKKCPTCNRTYSDITLLFCLEDGAPLSPAHESEETRVLEADNPTVHATKPGYDPEKSTAMAFTPSEQTSSTIRETPASKVSPHLIYAGAGLIAVLVIVGGLVWVSVSRNQPNGVGYTDNARKEANSTISNRAVSTSTPPVENSLLASGTIPINVPFTGVGTFSGRILIEMNGKASADHTMPDVGPEGIINHDAPNNNWALPGASLYCAIANVDGRVIYVGRRLELALTKPTAISLGLNDEPGVQGEGFKDNVGSWSYKITQISGSTNPTGNGRNNVPSVKQMQNDIEKEIKKMVDEANR